MLKDINKIIQESLVEFDKDNTNRKLINAIDSGWLSCAENPPDDNFSDSEDIAVIDRYGSLTFDSVYFVLEHIQWFLYWFSLPPLPDSVIKIKNFWKNSVNDE